MKIKQYIKDEAIAIWESEVQYKALIRFLKKNWYNQIYFDYVGQDKEWLFELEKELGSFNDAIKAFEIYRFCCLQQFERSRDQVRLIGFYLYKRYIKLLTKKMERLLTESKYYETDKLKVFKEFISRGYLPRDCIKNVDLRKDYYIVANIGGLIYDKPLNSQQEGFEFREKISLLGWGGIICPKS